MSNRALKLHKTVSVEKLIRAELRAVAARGSPDRGAWGRRRDPGRDVGRPAVGIEAVDDPAARP
jgi:hypothetical protein